MSLSYEYLLFTSYALLQIILKNSLNFIKNHLFFLCSGFRLNILVTIDSFIEILYRLSFHGFYFWSFLEHWSSRIDILFLLPTIFYLQLSRLNRIYHTLAIFGNCISHYQTLRLAKITLHHLSISILYNFIIIYLFD